MASVLRQSIRVIPLTVDLSANLSEEFYESALSAGVESSMFHAEFAHACAIMASTESTHARRRAALGVGSTDATASDVLQMLDDGDMSSRIPELFWN